MRYMESFYLMFKFNARDSSVHYKLGMSKMLQKCRIHSNDLMSPRQASNRYSPNLLVQTCHNYDLCALFIKIFFVSRQMIVDDHRGLAPRIANIALEIAA